MTERKVKTFVEVDEEVWRKLRSRAAGKGIKVSDALEDILRERFGMVKREQGEANTEADVK